MRNYIAALATSAFLFGATGASVAADAYDFDASHSQIIFSYNHLGFSTTYGMFSGFNGSAMLDMEDVSKSSVNLEINVGDLLNTGWAGRDGHFKSPDFFNVEKFPIATFTSTSVESTGEKTAKITGDLKILDQTKSVVLDTVLNQVGKHPQSQKDWAGFEATTTLKRTDFNLGKFAPYVSDEVEIKISVEMGKAEG
jgi:polyisoprenoid-binding protein YceI